MAPKKVQTQTATVHSTDTDTSTGQANNQAVTRRDLDMLAQNLTNAFAEQLRAAISANTTNPNPQVLGDMAAQIEDLRRRMDPPNDSQRRDNSQRENSQRQDDSRR